MNNTNRIIWATYLPLTFLILLFTTLYKIENPALYLKFGVRTAMFISVVMIRKTYKEQKLLVWAFLFTIVSDFFFSLMRGVNPDFMNRNLYGMLGFVMAYVFLIVAFQKNARFAVKEMITLLPFAVTFGVEFAILAKNAVGFMFWAAILLGAVLCYTGMTTVASLYRGYFSRNAACRIAIAGIILFISDMVVAFSIFHPDYQGFLLWKENFIWGTYMIGWTLLLSIATEEQLLVRKK